MAQQSTGKNKVLQGIQTMRDIQSPGRQKWHGVDGEGGLSLWKRILFISVLATVAALGWWMLAETEQLKKNIDENCDCGTNDDYKESTKMITIVMAVIGSLATVALLYVVYLQFSMK